MRFKYKFVYFGCLLTILIILLSSCSKYAIPSEKGIQLTTINDIFANPDKYDGNMVQVGGWVSSLRFVNIRYGAYTYFHLGDQSGKTISFVSIGILPIEEGDFISVTAKYKKSADLIWADLIESPESGRYK
jgi:hypothetical protein